MYVDNANRDVECESISKPCFELKRHRNSTFELSFGRRKAMKQKANPLP